MSTKTHIESGDLLLAEPFMKDPHFKRAVILVCEHNSEGSFGLVLNKRTDFLLNEIIDFPEFDAYAYYGGPVGTDTLHFVHRYGELIPDSRPLRKDIYWSGDFNRVKELVEQGQIEPSGIRFFVGYSGWGAGQLEAEMKENSWIVAGSYDRILQNDHELWKRVLHTLGGEYPMMANFPEDPSLN
jgi:putative transcriptional regulator